MSTNRPKYHHGNLRKTLISTSLELIAEVGLEGFSVAKVAKQAGVSSGAPYRHFTDRESILVATAVVYLTELTSRMRIAVNAAGKNPTDRLASTAGAYVQYAIEYNVGFELFAVVKGVHSAKLYERSREMINFLMLVVQEAKPYATWSEIVELMEAHLAISQGFAHMYYQGSFAKIKLTQEESIERVTTAAQYLINGWMYQ
ncbi:TetR/AcrR family transcriptional regulator [Halobacillus shinanisalinarum]|uniref:TetR/AcrR family transcriptional regulator n=1 Tax=Halobacillus shinanisalinarum TaxID=2932258 RepID=A0ABY4H160_9BACI|nr:TetR/AcrR family transcriptional regulator [Halobacillus shinanisalinarum]UOQ93921.1 TetR/AcrR family transcriptional regulator [Halobacillus shinanisalinarum]